MPADDFRDLSPRSSRRPLDQARRRGGPPPRWAALLVTALGVTGMVVGGLAIASKLKLGQPAKEPALGRGFLDPKAAEFRERMKAFVEEAKALARAFDDGAILKLLEDKAVSLGESLSRVPEPPPGGEKIREKARLLNDRMMEAVRWARMAIESRLRGLREWEKKEAEHCKETVAKARQELAEIEALLQ